MGQKFTLHSFSGVPKAHYLVDTVTPSNESTTISADLAHHIMIVDRSGSMYYDIEDLKDMLIKVLTLDEYNNSDLKVSLLSYSSVGDLTAHFERVAVKDIMSRESTYIDEIRRIRVTGLTCISQSLEYAKSLIKDGDLTAITLHSDGYANHPSSYSENDNLDRACADLSGQGNVFINTIAYSDWSDFKLLSRVANSMSGSCVKANNVKEVYDSINETTQTLIHGASPAVSVEIEGADYQVFASESARRINGSNESLTISGVTPEDDKIVYQYTEVTKEEYENSSYTECNTPGTGSAVYAFARAQLAEGRLSTAKFAVAGVRDATVLEAHSKALTNDQIADFATALEDAALNQANASSHKASSSFGLAASGPTVLDALTALDDNKYGILLDFKALTSVYVKRSLKRVPGTRDENGKLVEPWLKVKNTDDGEFVKVNAFEFNRSTATVNMRIERSAQLVKADDGSVISQVAGQMVDQLKTFNNYTVVGDGEITVPSISLKITKKSAFDNLSKYFTDGDSYSEGAVYTIDLSGMPLINFDGNFSSLKGVFEKLAGLKVVSSVLSALTKESSDTLTPEQIEELGKHYLSKSLNINFPTTNEYTDLDEAISNGTVDSRVSYEISIGNTQIANLSKLHSANKFLDRIYELHDADGNKISKPKFTDVKDSVIIGHKTLSARTKLTPVDDLMRPIFDAILNLGSIDDVDDVNLRSLIAKVDLSDPSSMVSLSKTVDNEIERTFKAKVSPLVFYIGSTGLLPDEVDTNAETADDITARHADLKLSKSEKDGSFFEIGDDVIISVAAKNVNFTRTQS
jgi:hypothetical protein